MGTSTDAIICFGVSFEEDTEFPWDDNKWSDIDEWWLYEVCGYKDPFEMWDETGNYIDGIEPPEEKQNEYYDTRRAFKEKHPLLIELVPHCHCDNPMYIVAAKGTVLTASRGYPQEVTPEILTVSNETREALINFCKEHGLEGEPKWWLASDWSN